ncbi:ROK family glucokinase [Gracilibacillus alcaliphilus]|uniref:ROK family glucokinase n=1 Tax=Gracilibacillus alcaliphilus TaxID=1401441 RepID=UPI00195B434B|nr:ROK family glucokinase [Gracilibacillus alcaliphilus]MBM7675029.1 glucokinase [Gracilibacillus alcaliphilus]
MEKDLLIGIDIGGTTVKNAIITKQGELIAKWEVNTDLSDQGVRVPDDVWASIENKLTELDISKDRFFGMGVGAPGFIEPETGKVAIAVNIGWQDFALKDILEKVSGLPVYVENDANIAALGENWMGSGNQVENMIAVTLGTGVGGGIIANGQVISGANGTGAEIGHITVEKDGAYCNCGRYGCLETVTSATGIVRQAQELMEVGKAEPLQQRKEQNGAITAKDVFEVAEAGDADCKELLLHVCDVLGATLAMLAITTNPAKIVIGGGVSKAGDIILEPLKEAFEKYTLPRTNEACDFEIAQLGNDAGVYGGAYLVLQNS